MDLYISDLDGTLLNENAEISNKSKDLLNRSITNNINFTIATARTPATVIEILKGVNITLPIITMNGAAIYDIKENKYLHYNKINTSMVKKLKKIISKYNINAFIYTIKNNHLYVYHSNHTNSYQKEFYAKRINSKYKTFIDGELDDDAEVLYFTILDYEANISDLYNDIKDINDLYVVKYTDVYNKDFYNLEIYDINSSKAHAINAFKKHYNFNRLITFGDNKNDIPMFKISDECYAVKNAVSDLKEVATGTIGLNIEDSVAKFIEKKIK